MSAKKYSKVCPCCQKIFHKLPNKSYEDFSKRIYCSRQCAGQKISKELFYQERLKHILSKTITTESGCMEWQGYINKSGYGGITISRKPLHAHRWVWILSKGNISKGLHVLHKCDNRKCVNVDHLFLGTNEDNHKDKVSKGRQAKGVMFPFTKITEKEVDEMILLAKSGNAYKDIGIKFNICKEHVSRLLLQNGFSKIKIGVKEEKLVIKLAQKGISYTQIGKELNITRGHASHIAIKNGIHRR